MADDITEAGKDGIVIGALAAHQVLSAQIEKYRIDAERYQALRAQHWSDGPDALVVVRASDLRLATNVMTYSGERLDDVVDQLRGES